MINIEELRADIEAGTPGDWHARRDPGHFGTLSDIYQGREMLAQVVHRGALKMEANTRRIARLPQLEREYLAMREALEWMSREVELADMLGYGWPEVRAKAKAALGETQ